MTRRLPARVNPCLSENVPPYHELVDLRRLGQTNLGSGKSIAGNDLGLFSYVHLRAPLPQITDSEIFGTATPESYFLMRRSHDGFVSSTGMFKASFPWATKRDEEDERKYVKDYFIRTSKDETAGNLWVHPADALTLADEYGMKIWIEALLDNQAVSPSDRKRIISPPPPFFKEGLDASNIAEILAPPTLSTANSSARRRSTRSTSPSKRILSPRKARLTKANIAKDSPLKHEALVFNGIKDNKSETSAVEGDEDIVATTTTTVTTEETVATTETVTEETIKRDPTIKVEIDNVHQSNGEFEVDKTRLKIEYTADEAEFLPIPEQTEDLMATAREMVEESKKLDGEAIGRKRKVQDITKSEGKHVDDDEIVPDAKKSRVLEQQLRREKIRAKALIGLSIGLTLTALIPHFL
ncbi:hypothetical protein DFH27DRAFT_357173 [Peziza echinospora]|nr:hypothetical protein DFH27DRAFT_357173 [Peziza echinospora]